MRCSLPYSENVSAKAMRCRGRLAFTLIEVVIATGIFFMCMFAMLGVLSQNLRMAGSLQRQGPTPGLVAADLWLTNQLEEGIESGDFGEAYPGYRWARGVSFYASNGLWKVDIAITRDGKPDSVISFLRYASESGGGGPGGTMRLGGESKFR